MYEYLTSVTLEIRSTQPIFESNQENCLQIKSNSHTKFGYHIKISVSFGIELQKSLQKCKWCFSAKGYDEYGYMQIPTDYLIGHGG